MKAQTIRVEYDSNNSGGSWWLSDKDWAKLEDAGWTVEWGGLDFCNDKHRLSSERHVAPDTHEPNECRGHRRSESYQDALASGDRWLGSIARGASIEVEAYSETLAEGIAAEWWADTLGMDPNEEGCNCCGRPHSFWARAAR